MDYDYIISRGAHARVYARTHTRGRELIDVEWILEGAIWNSIRTARKLISLRGAWNSVIISIIRHYSGGLHLAFNNQFYGRELRFLLLLPPPSPRPRRGCTFLSRPRDYYVHACRRWNANRITPGGPPNVIALSRTRCTAHSFTRPKIRRFPLLTISRARRARAGCARRCTFIIGGFIRISGWHFNRVTRALAAR